MEPPDFSELLNRFVAEGEALRERAEREQTPEAVAALQKHVERQRLGLFVAELLQDNPTMTVREALATIGIDASELGL